MTREEALKVIELNIARCNNSMQEAIKTIMQKPVEHTFTGKGLSQRTQRMCLDCAHCVERADDDYFCLVAQEETEAREYCENWETRL